MVSAVRRAQMGKPSWIYRLLKKIGLIKSYELTEAELVEMCNRAISSGVCPNAYDRCAWNRSVDGE